VVRYRCGHSLTTMVILIADSGRQEMLVGARGETADSHSRIVANVTPTPVDETPGNLPTETMPMDSAR
jgi:hypothetical protein